MSFAKAQDLLRLALMACGHGGVSLQDIALAFGVSHRTAQRMTEALEASFFNVEHEDGDDRRRRWRIRDARLPQLMPRQDTAVEALEIAIRHARDENRLRHARALEDMRDGMIARLAPRDARRAEADAEAVLSLMGHVARPGPRARLSPPVLEAVIEALRGPFRLAVDYGTSREGPRILEPHGLLMGPRTYLVARQDGRDDTLRSFRLDRIRSAEVLDQGFALAPGFSIENHAARAFGAWQDPGQYGEVVWHFAASAADRAADFLFHPDQTLEPQDDGSLIVRFYAAGWLEMAWHLYQWGDKVEVLAPEGLRTMIDGHRRNDFSALP